MRKPETKKISIDLPVETLTKIDLLAEQADIPRQKLIANILEVDADTLMDCRKVGILHLAVLLRDRSETIKEWSRKMREKKSLNGLEPS
ncbi:MAG: hypothetical protein JRF02_06640 [Deltaproteobacteria bacterium]|jgi:hypothetical protein|nr:hypothetical protein [Deltaproteobacteria bacterium]